MTLIPLILSAIAIARLCGAGHDWLLWSIVAVTVLAWLTNAAVRNSHRMETTGLSDRQITNFWTVASMVAFLLNCGIAIWGIVVSLQR